MLGQRVIDNDKIPLCLVSAPPLLLTFGEGSWFAIGLAAAPCVPKVKGQLENPPLQGADWPMALGED